MPLWLLRGRAYLKRKIFQQFFSFGFAASAAYILNDLLDLEEDRRHLTKKQRPFASGRTFAGSDILLAGSGNEQRLGQ